MRKQTWITFNGTEKLLVLVAFVLLLVSFGCGGSGGTDDGTDDPSVCGTNEHLEGGVCVCDTGFVPGDNGCVEASGGDKDDSGKTDGDKDQADPDGDDDKDVDKVDPDGDDDKDITDSSDENSETDDEELCTCPVINGEYCVDPEIVAPTYLRVIVSPGSKPGCSLHVVVYDEFHAAFSGGVTCNEEGRALLPTLGCIFDYSPVDEEVSLICGSDLFNFKTGWCVAIDGDEEKDSDIDVESDAPDADQDSDQVDADDDVVDGDDDVDKDVDKDVDDDSQADGDQEIDEIDDDSTPCASHQDCPSTHYCNMITHKCVPDICNDIDICPPGMECDEWGQCIGADGDMVEEDYDQVIPDSDDITCSTDEDCPQQYWCSLSSSICVLGCSSNLECPPDMPVCDNHGHCNEAEGDGDVADSDYEIPQGCDCVIIDEEQDLDTCSYGNYCNEVCRCVFDCTKDEDCQVALGAWCDLDKGRCKMPEPECEIDEDCDSGYYCNFDRTCVQGCPGVPCPTEHVCIDDHGHCEWQPPDGDQEGTVCGNDSECGFGYYCNESSGECVQDCIINQDCVDQVGSGWVCSVHGECVEDNIICSDDDDCLASMYCIPYTGCIQGCETDEYCQDLYGPMYLCMEHGHCNFPDPADGDEEFDGTYCTSDEGCPVYNYCDLETHACVEGCTNTADCGVGWTCDYHGHCIEIADYDPEEYTPPGYCDTDEQCPTEPDAYPSGQYCGADNSCTFDCFYGAEDDGCGEGQYCDENGRCQMCGADDDCASENMVMEPCGPDGECATGYHCEATETLDFCVTECPCAENFYCDDEGYCIMLQDGDEELDVVEEDDEPFVMPCLGPGDCPLGTYCGSSGETTQCLVDCILDSDCQSGYYCNCRGQCHADPDFNECLPALSCAGNWDCAGTVCETIYGGMYCHLYCMPDENWGCDAGEFCDDLTGLCQTSPVDGDEEPDIDIELEPEQDDLFGCFDTGDCPNGMYCDIDGYCKQDCTPTRSVSGCTPSAPDCEAYQICSEHGQCYSPTSEGCASDSECPKGNYCLNVGGVAFCTKCCSSDFDCSEGTVCDTNRGRCVVDGSQDPNPVYPSCGDDCDCPVWSHCDAGSCVSECMEINGCYGESYCDLSGTCQTDLPDGDVDIVDNDIVESDTDVPTCIAPVFVCSDDNYCPYHTFCDLGMSECRADCVKDSDCQGGQVCDDRGVCVETPWVWDGSGHLYLQDCTLDTDCPTGTYCWTEGNVCRVDCVCDDESGATPLNCDAGFTCDYDRGRCEPLKSRGGK